MGTPSRRRTDRGATARALVDTAVEPRRQRMAPEDRAAQILDVAARLLMQEGFTEVSMERLGREAGISKALVYNYFPNLADLLRALLAREVGALHERQSAAIAQARGFEDLVRRTTRLYIEHIQSRGPLLNKLWAEPAVARLLADDQVTGRERAMRFMARQVAKEYGLPQAVALPAVDMQMALTEAAAQHLARAQGDIDFATEICVTLLLGGLEALARQYGQPRESGAPARQARASARRRAETPAA